MIKNKLSIASRKEPKMKSRTLSTYWKVGLPLLIMVICLTTLPQVIQAQSGPPPQAIQACRNKSQGAACAFTAKGRARITGTCRTVRNVLACVPGDGPPTETPTTPPLIATPMATPTPPPSTPTASYPVVDTGQTTCYNNSGAISCPQPGESVTVQGVAAPWLHPQAAAASGSRDRVFLPQFAASQASVR